MISEGEQTETTPPPERGRFWNQPARTARLPGAKHQKAMRTLHLGLPLVAAALLGIVMAWPRLQAAMAPVVRQSAEVAGGHGSNELLHPVYKGIDKNGQPYTVTADHAEQSLNDQNTTLMIKPLAIIKLKNGHIIHVRADHGVYNRDEAVLDLDGHVVSVDDQGNSFATSTLHIDTNNKEAQTDAPVTGAGPAGTILSHGVQGYDDSQVLIFKGPAHMVLYQGQAKEQRQQQMRPQATEGDMTP